VPFADLVPNTCVTPAYYCSVNSAMSCRTMSILAEGGGFPQEAFGFVESRQMGMVIAEVVQCQSETTPVTARAN